MSLVDLKTPVENSANLMRLSEHLPVFQLRQMESLVPSLKKKDVPNMQPDERDEVVQQSEQLTVEWIHAFLDEIYRIDDFFKTRQLELINNFIGLQDKFRIRTEKYEVGSTRTGRSKNSKKTQKQDKEG